VLFGCASETQFDLQEVASPYAYQYTWEQERIYHAATGTELSERELYDYLAGFRVIYVGESHDSVNDHEVQLKILRALVERFPGEVALGLEMLRTDSQAKADQWVAGEMSEKEWMRLWAENWGLSSYPYYRDMLLYVREQRLPLVALNRPRDTMSRPAIPVAGTEGVTAPAPLADPEIDWDDPYYEAYLTAFLSGHEAGPETLQKFLRGQLLWDETMAESGAAFLGKPANHSSKLVVFAGSNHLRYGFGVPRRLFRRVPVNYTIVSPVVANYPADSLGKLMDIEPPELPLPPADVIWLVGYEDLEDQRITLGISIAQTEGGGVLVQEVHPGSPGERAGLTPEDIIRGIDEAEVAEMFDLSYELGRKAPGDRGTLTIERNGSVRELNVEFEHYARP
jgi:uncharacterized iron-regulated protein